MKDREDAAKLEADKKAKEILVSCMQRYSNEEKKEEHTKDELEEYFIKCMKGGPVGSYDDFSRDNWNSGYF